MKGTFARVYAMVLENYIIRTVVHTKDLGKMEKFKDLVNYFINLGRLLTKDNGTKDNFMDKE